ncbi:MAG TPA: carboxypeptidase-like regulatory domain-containing protein, partial [Longimicrobiaceae bacterium]|nr:carboxypeptidase-like regulatory domain-containing protein [Longimicrobiaceae bacterium]
VLSGTILDSDTDSPVGSAAVRLIDESGVTVGTAVGSEAGTFRVTAPGAGVYSIEVRRVGYEELRADGLRLVAEEPLEVEIRIGIDAVPLDPVVVVVQTYYEPGWITDFRARAEANQRVGRGRIYTRADIDRLRPARAENLLAFHPWRGGCQPHILLDGLPADGSLSMIPGDELEGVEIYRGAQIPAEYYRTGMCGLVMVWRRIDAPGMGPLTWRRIGVAAVVLLLFGLSTLAF